jgi:hypothetical protein
VNLNRTHNPICPPSLRSGWLNILWGPALIGGDDGDDRVMLSSEQARRVVSISNYLICVGGLTGPDRKATYVVCLLKLHLSADYPRQWRDV